MGYSYLEILHGGFSHWQQNGLPTITGDYVLAHALGLYVDQELSTPSISADSLMRKLEAREDFLILDSRDPGDYRDSTLPGSENVPIAEPTGHPSDKATAYASGIALNLARQRNKSGG